MIFPYLVLNEIFSYLNLKDKLNCRLVCRRWRSNLLDYDLKNSKSFQNLFLHNQAFPTNKKCTFTNQLIGYSNSFETQKLIDFIGHPMTRSYFENLKKLIIFSLYDTNCGSDQKFNDFGENISFFQQLRHLEISGLTLKNKSSFRLKNLQTLSLKDMQIDHLVLDTECLTNLICWIDIERIEIKFPSKLEYLELKNQKDDFKFDLKFENLTFLNFYDTTRSIANDFLNNLPSIKKFIFFTSNAESKLKELNRQKIVYDLNDLKLIPFGFENFLIKQADSIDTFCCYMLYEYYLNSVVSNYSRLNHQITWPLFVDYCALANRFKQIPECFFSKFIDFYIVFVGREIKNWDKLIDFIKRCGYVYQLILQNTQFEQKFYDELQFCSYINKLKIIEQSTPSSIDYITKYEFLSKLTINEIHFEFYYIPIQLIYYGFKNRYLRIFRFKKNSTVQLTIFYHLKNDHEIILEINDSLFNVDSIDQAIDQIKNNQITKHLLI